MYRIGNGKGRIRGDWGKGIDGVGGLWCSKAFPDRLFYNCPIPPPGYYKSKTLINMHFSVFFMQCCKYNINRRKLVFANSICKYYNDKIAFTLVRDKL